MKLPKSITEVEIPVAGIDGDFVEKDQAIAEGF